jgi:pumilio RNA-binding family
MVADFRLFSCLARPVPSPLALMTPPTSPCSSAHQVVQYLVTDGSPEDRSAIIAKIRGQLLPLSQQKFASNVVEKCVVHATAEEREQFVAELLQPAEDGGSTIRSMLVHPFANYPLQKLLQVVQESQRAELFAQTGRELAELRKLGSSYSKHLITIEKLLAAERIRTNTY